MDEGGSLIQSKVDMILMAPNQYSITFILLTFHLFTNSVYVDRDEAIKIMAIRILTERPVKTQQLTDTCECNKIWSPFEKLLKSKIHFAMRYSNIIIDKLKISFMKLCFSKLCLSNQDLRLRFLILQYCSSKLLCLSFNYMLVSYA